MKIYKKALAWLLCLTMLVTMSTGVAFAGETDIDPAAAGTETSVEEQALPETEEPSASETEEQAASEPVEPLAEDESDSGSITFVAGDETVVITADDIKAATFVTATAAAPWTNKTGSVFVGTFYSLKSILDAAGIDCSEAHGIKAVARDGFTNGFTKDEIDDVYIYDQGEVTKNGEAAGTKGTYGTAINGADVAGNKWATDVVSVEVVSDHVWFTKGGACKHYCAICGDSEPSLTINSDASEAKVYDCQIKDATSVTTTTDENAWGYQGKNFIENKFIGTFYSLESILVNAGIDYSEAHGIKAVAGDFTSSFTQDEIEKVYIYDQGEVTKNGAAAGTKGTYGTALEGTAGPGNKWAKSIVSITIVTLQELVNAAGNGGTATINRDVDYGTETVTITVPEGDPVTLDLGGKTITAGTLKAEGGTLEITNGTVKAKLEGTIKAISGKYSIEVPKEMCDGDKVPVYSAADGLYEVKEVSAYDSQKTANELEKTIVSLQAQIEQLTAKIKAGSVAVSAKAVATAYNSVTLTWEGDQPADGFRVEKKIDGVWTEVTTVTEGKYVDKGEPGITNEYRVAPYALYGDNQKEYGKYVTASAKPGLGKAAIYSLTSKSKKLTTKWRTVSGAASYDVYIGTNSSVTKGLVKYTNVKSYYKISKKLKKGKTYYVKVRARVTNSQGKVVYGAWSTVKKIKCK